MTTRLPGSKCLLQFCSGIPQRQHFGTPLPQQLPGQPAAPPARGTPPGTHGPPRCPHPPPATPSRPAGRGAEAGRSGLAGRAGQHASGCRQAGGATPHHHTGPRALTSAPSMTGATPGATSRARALSACSTAEASMWARRCERAVASTMKSVKGQRPRTSMMQMSSPRASAGGGSAAAECCLVLAAGGAGLGGHPAPTRPGFRRKSRNTMHSRPAHPQRCRRPPPD